MPDGKLRPDTICLALACVVLVACGAPQPTATLTPAAVTVAVPSISNTEVIQFAPAVPVEEREGSCLTNSFSVRRAEAWRCTVDDQILDPCFTAADGETIVCGAFPGTDSPGFRLKLTAALPAAALPPGAPASVFMIRLADGTLCHSASGPALALNGKAVHFNCVGGSPSAQIVLLGDLQEGTVWRAERASVAPNDGGFTIQNAEMVEIRTVWQ
jgi:hypothetical protein